MSFRTAKKRAPTWVIVIAVFYAALHVTWKIYEYMFWLSHVPEPFKVWAVLYAEEKVWGFGPGGNESGVITYYLPSDIAENMRKGKMDYFSSLPDQRLPNSAFESTGQLYDKWYETPIKEDWVPKEINELGFDMKGVGSYVENMGFTFDHAVECEINNAIRTPGSYYAPAHQGFIVVSPKAQRVYFFYSG